MRRIKSRLGLELGTATVMCLACAVGRAQTPAQHEEAVRLSNRGLELTEAGRHLEAVGLYDQALRLEASNQSALFNRATSLYRLRRFSEALADGNRAIELDPQKGKYLSLRALILQDMGRMEEARAAYQKLLLFDPGNAISINNWGTFLIETGALAESVAALSRAYALNPAYVLTRENLQFAYKRLGIPAPPGVNGTPAEAAPASSPPNSPPALAPREGEIRLDGRVLAVDAKAGAVTFEALSFSVPGGRFKALPAVKRKVAILGSVLPSLGWMGRLPVEVLRPGDVVAVTGRDDGKSLRAREIAAGGRSGREEQERGQLLSGLQVPRPAEAQPPAVSREVVGNPSFSLAEGTRFTAGTAFVAREGEGPRVLISALHLLGTSGGLKEDIAAQDVGRRVSEVRSAGAIARRALSSSGFTLGSRDGDFSGDVVAFALEEAPQDAQPKAALALSPANARPGELVWIVGPTAREPLLHPATVILSDSKRLIVQAHTAFEGQGFSGAPLVNRQGQVVGMELGGVSSYTVAAPVQAIREHLKPAGAVGP